MTDFMRLLTGEAERLPDFGAPASNEEAGFGNLDAINAEVLRRLRRNIDFGDLTDEEIIGIVRFNPQFADAISKIERTAATPEYSTKDETRGYLANFLDNMLLGGADEFVGGLNAVSALFDDRDFSDAYYDQKQQVLDDIDEYEMRDPGHWIDPDVLGFAASMALPGSTFLRTGRLGTAGMAGAAAAPLPNMTQLALRGAGLGTAYGTLAGVLEPEAIGDESLSVGQLAKSGAMGGLMGGALGGVLTPLAAGLGTAAAGRLRRRFGDPEIAGGDMIAEAAVADGAPLGGRGDLSPYMSRNPDAMLLDMGTEFARNVPALGRYAARNIGPGAAYAASNIVTRQRGLGDRVRDALRRLLGDGLDGDDLRQAIRDDRRSIGREMFEGNLIMRQPEVDVGPEMLPLFSRILRTDAPRALEDAAELAGRPQPTLLPAITGRGKLDTRSLIDLSSQLGRDVTAYGKRVGRGERGASYIALQEMRNLHRELVDWMDGALGGAYAPAREAYRASHAFEEALDAGAGSLWLRDPREVARLFNGLQTDAERNAFRSGALEAYMRSLPELQSHDNVSKLQIGTRIPEIMRILARNPREYNAFAREIAELWNQHQKGRSVYANSDTASNIAAQEAIEGHNFGNALGAMLSSDPIGALQGGVGRRIVDWAQRGAAPRTRHALANMLFTSRNSVNQPPPIAHGVGEVSIPRPTADDLDRYIRIVESAPERLMARYNNATAAGAGAARLPAQAVGKRESMDRLERRRQMDPWGGRR